MAHQDTRFQLHQKIGITNIYRDIDLLKEHINNIRKKKVKSLIVFRGLPGSGKTHLAETLENVELFNLTNYLSRDKEGNIVYTFEAMKNAHISMRRDILQLLRNNKNLNPIVVDAPHIYLWELKYYRVQACQYSTEFIVYECRTLFSKDSETRAKQLADINITEMISDIIAWLNIQNSKGKMLPSQTQLLKYLTMENAIKKLVAIKPSNNSFCPNTLLNIQLAAWLTHRSPNNIYMDLVWNMLVEWDEITNDDLLWKCSTPHWGY